MRQFQASLTPLRFLALVMALVVMSVLGICLLPHDRYVQFSALHDGAVVKAGWIYERIHFDDTPIDVMFVGTSHTVFGVNSAQVEQAYGDATGQQLHVVNFGLPHLGRDIQYLVAREAIETRRVKLLVIEIADDESRSLHPAFFELATPRELLEAPILINPLYLDNLSRLPLRQVSLFLQSALPGWMGTNPDFDRAKYRGPNWDDTYQERGSVAYPILNAPPRLQVHTSTELEAQHKHYVRLQQDKLQLPGFMQNLAYRANLLYLQWIVELARQHDVAVQLLYLPVYHAPASPLFAGYYAQFGKLWYPDMIYAEINNWLDVNHLNFQGSSALSHWLGVRIAEEQGNGIALTATRHP